MPASWHYWQQPEINGSARINRPGACALFRYMPKGVEALVGERRPMPSSARLGTFMRRCGKRAPRRSTGAESLRIS